MHQVAVVGAGRIGKIHASNVLACPDLTLKYVVDPIPEAAAQIATQSNAQVVHFDQILADSAIAGVIIASSTDTHLDYSVRAVQAGKAVFCEKPLDLDLKRARSAEAVLRQSAVPVFVGFNRRFDPHFQRLQDRLQAEEMGMVETVHIISHDPAPPPIDYVTVSGGLFKDMSIHDFDMARWLLGEEPVEVYAAGACLVDPAIAKAGDIDTAKILLRTASGKICLISNSRRSGYGYDQRIEVFCSNGMIRAANVHTTTVESWGLSGSRTEPLQNFFLDRYEAAYRAEIAHFVQILAGAQPLVGYDDGIKALSIAEAAAASHSAGNVVLIDP